jgi:hypothetical protein
MGKKEAIRHVKVFLEDTNEIDESTIKEDKFDDYLDDVYDFIERKHKKLSPEQLVQALTTRFEMGKKEAIRHVKVFLEDTNEIDESTLKKPTV